MSGKYNNEVVSIRMTRDEALEITATLEVEATKDERWIKLNELTADKGFKKILQKNVKTYRRIVNKIMTQI